MELEEPMQKCSVCKRILPYSCFGKPSRTKNGIRHQCLECRRIEETAYRVANADKIRERSRENARKRRDARNESYRNRTRNDPDFRDKQVERGLFRRYGISVEDREKLYEQQNHACAICGIPRTEKMTPAGYKRNMSVDHDHKTGEVRGLLCPVCNSALGFIESDRHQKALAYLDNPPFKKLLQEQLEIEK
jgi:Recombination endonuclease VII